MLFLLEEKCVEVLASAVETSGEGLVLSFEKVQIAVIFTTTLVARVL